MNNKKVINVLIADDEDLVLELISEIIPKFLPDLSFDIQLAKNGQQALEMLNRETYHLLITDYKMPELNGLELIKAIKANDLHTKMKIFLMTGAEYTSDISTALSLSDAHMFKPVKTDHLLETISLWFGARKWRSGRDSNPRPPA